MEMLSLMKGVAGGVLIGCSAVVLMGLLGRIAGVSGLVSGLLFERDRSDRGWRLAFVLGLISAPLWLTLGGPGWGNVADSAGAVIGTPMAGVPIMLLAGLLVGAGTGIGSGCTSGHGVCGLARLSPRSLAATLTFVAVAMLTVFVTHHLMGGSA
ncbi:YeeE/YedE family protein [Kushneria phosphatilytica]|uniref:YeeE/YedE family protein n=1 Tax=Kushneria phosphatilytica TaxID=657387 RepID=A0A1S1NUI1_9GAMM|nr:YeeE/YedE family protein [Kushneria phosphatilytica]OHV10011.1 hypothetical protein BH688_10400 [Kushneria phosphatilytica]QEL11696.1 YeeE/YedE family protein [Kushneria phosphatilytica]